MLFPAITPLYQLQSDVPGFFRDQNNHSSPFSTRPVHAFRPEPLVPLNILVPVISLMSLFQLIIPAVVARLSWDVSPSIHSTVLPAQEQPSQFGTLVPVISMSFQFGSTRRHLCLPCPCPSSSLVSHPSLSLPSAVHTLPYLGTPLLSMVTCPCFTYFYICQSQVCPDYKRL